MTKWKEYLKNHGVKFECDYPMMPYDLGSQSILGIYPKCCDDCLKVIIEYNSIIVYEKINRYGILTIENE